VVINVPLAKLDMFLPVSLVPLIDPTHHHVIVMSDTLNPMIIVKLVLTTVLIVMNMHLVLPVMETE